MISCPKCGHQPAESGALYCSRCGTALSAGSVTAAALPAAARKKKLWMMLLPLNIVLVTGAVLMAGKGCSSVEGTLVSRGGEMGDFTFVPKQCRSGQRMSFFGSVLLGEGRQDGAVVAILDPVKGKIVKVEVPGSCEPPDYEKCKEVVIDPKHCSVYDMKLERTSIMVNEIVLIKGSLDLDCTFPGGGTAKGSMTFDRCN
jgi:hypothetical protein